MPRYRTLYYPDIRYQTEDGKNITFTSSSGSYPSPYRKGDKVEILYDPENPLEARIMSFRSMWLFPVLFFGIGGILIITGSVILMWKWFSGSKIEWFKRNGMPIMAEIEKINVNKKLRLIANISIVFMPNIWISRPMKYSFIKVTTCGMTQQNT